MNHLWALAMTRRSKVASAHVRAAHQMRVERDDHHTAERRAAVLAAEARRSSNLFGGG
jgi:hypothetical protein